VHGQRASQKEELLKLWTKAADSIHPTVGFLESDSPEIIIQLNIIIH
jgi:hypothetical protein